MTPLDAGTIRVQRRADGVTLLSLGGRHDLLTAGELELAIADALRRGDAIVVDLRETSFVDSAVLQTLVSGRAMARSDDRPFVLESGACAGVARALEVAGLVDPKRPSDERGAEGRRSAPTEPGARPVSNG